MSGIAHLLIRCGMRVSGSELKETKITRELKAQGAEIFLGHSAKNIKGASVVIYSSAIKEDNPEIMEAKRSGIPLLRRAEALANLMREKEVITVTGSHGKTTTTSLVSFLLLEAGLNPTAAIGGILRNINANAHFGNGNFFVAEADESDGSFLYYRPKFSIITNIDREHLDYYKEFGNELNAFKEFINLTRPDGCVFYCADDNNLSGLIEDYTGRRVSFGFKESADIYPKNIRISGLASDFDCYYKNKFVARFNLSLGGMHNISNSLSAIALGIELGIDLKFIKKALSHYKGAKRRLEVKYCDKGLMAIDDYAHHPTEIKATLSAAKELNTKRIIAVFQPHRYTRTKILLDEFSGSFGCADIVYVTDIYAASEAPLEGVSGVNLAAAIKKNEPSKEVLYLPKEEIINHVLRVIEPGDLVITLGAGDIVKLSDELAQRLHERS